MSKEQFESQPAACTTLEPEPGPSDLALQPKRFTKNEQRFMVAFVAFIGLFSPLTSNIYFPAIPTLVIAFHKSTELINLSVTMYILLQGTVPMVWGTISDHIGRRPISAACLLILSLSCIGLALVPTSAYWLLMVLRCLQAVGSASTVAIGAGVIGDITTREERAGFYGFFMFGPLVGPSIGPVIGGALSGSIGWRFIFWVLFIAASICFVIIILLQPETLKSVVEGERDQNPILYRPVIPIIGRPISQRPGPPAAREATVKVSRNPFTLFLHLDILFLLALNAIINSLCYGMTVSISSLFSAAYPSLNDTKIGLCYLAMGGGLAIGSLIIGRVLDWEYQTFRRRAITRHGIMALELATADITKEIFFSLEQARLRLLPFFIFFLLSSCVGYGWAIQRQVNIACPLILQFIAGLSSIAIMNASSTLMIDLIPDQSSSVTACSNVVRCSLSAIMVSVIELMLNGIGIGWTYILLAGFCALALPLVYGSMIFGPRFRINRQRAREETLAQAAQQRSELDQ